MSTRTIDININAKVNLLLTTEATIYLKQKYKREFNIEWKPYFMDTLWSFFYEFSSLVDKIDDFLKSNVEISDVNSNENRKFNLLMDSFVKFELTDYGKKVLPELQSSLNKNGQVEMILTDFIEKTGKYYFMGGQTILKDNQINMEVRG